MRLSLSLFEISDRPEFVVLFSSDLSFPLSLSLSLYWILLITCKILSFLVYVRNFYNKIYNVLNVLNYNKIMIKKERIAQKLYEKN